MEKASASQEHALAEQFAQRYTKEMKGHDISFAMEPYSLYKLAFLQHLLEKGAFLQLKWAVTGIKKPQLLEVYLAKISEYGEEYWKHIHGLGR